MKSLRHFIAALATLVFGVSGFAQEATPPLTGGIPAVAVNPMPALPKDRKISLLPDQKMPLLLKQAERNPFARRNPDVSLISETEEQETEAELIRDALNGLTVSGRSYGPNGLRVLAEGSLIFERGKIVPPVIQGQTESLVVESVDEKLINLAWIDSETGKFSGKRISIPYDLTPRVRMIMKGQTIKESAGDTPELIEVAFDREEKPKRKGPGHNAPPEELPNGIVERAFIEGQ